MKGLALLAWLGLLAERPERVRWVRLAYDYFLFCCLRAFCSSGRFGMLSV